MGPMMLPRPRLAVLLCCALLVACTAAPSTTPSASAPTSVGPSVSETATSPPSVAPPAVSPSPAQPPIAADPPPLAISAVASGFVDPIGIATAPDGTLLVNERLGRVIALDPATGETAVALDIRDRVLGQSEQGLLGLAVHPDWPEAPRAFVHYSDRNGDTVLSEFAATSAEGWPITLDAGSERVLLQREQPYANHNGGQLAFGPDGYLYLGLGDGGSGGDPGGNGQNPHTLLGKILRLDVDAGGDEPYVIPQDNPFADGDQGAPEVHLLGLRNPWRFSFDSATGLLWIADVGQNRYEEIDRVDPVDGAGTNFGWVVMEASHCYAVDECDQEGLALPVAEYGRDLGCSVTGGHVYRGGAIDGLEGWYLFSDYCSGLLFGIPSDAEGVAAPRILLETGANVTAFGQDAAGELYVADIATGSILRIVGE